MNALDNIEALVTQAETYEVSAAYCEVCLTDARDLLAQEALAGNKLDTERLTALVHRCGKNAGDHTDGARLIRWGNFMTNVVGFISEGVVGMKDGRLATADGWDYTNCEPDDLHCQISRTVSEELQAYVGTLTDAEPSNDPDRDLSGYDDRFNETVEAALRAYGFGASDTDAP